MRLLIGGLGQGMRETALLQTGLSLSDVADGATCTLEDASHAPILDRLHRFIQRELSAGRDPEQAVARIVATNPDVILLCDELGCGIVPLDPDQRSWRECTGRICCQLAARATRVERLCCGISIVIKEDL